MTFEGMQEVLSKVDKLKTANMSVRDHIVLAGAYSAFAEAVAPLVSKYVDGEDVQHRMFDVVGMLKKIKEAANEQDGND